MKTMAYYETLDRELSPCVREFKRRVYCAGMREIINACPKRGMSGLIVGIAVRTYVIAGRVMVTLEDGHTDVTMLAAEEGDDPRLGLHSANGSLSHAADMLLRVADGWVGALAIGEPLRSDDGVSII